MSHHLFNKKCIKFLSFPVLLLAGLLLTAGCVRDAGVYYTDGYPSSNQHHILHASTREKIEILSKHQQETPGGVQRALIKGRNLSSNQITLKYRVEWLDGSGHPVHIQSIWKHVDVAARDFFTIQDIAPNPAASGYRIIFGDNTSPVQNTMNSNLQEASYENN